MRIADVSIKRPVFAVMLIAVLVVFGAISYSRIGVDLFPDVEFPVATVTVVYPGADPQTMESEVADPIEERLNTLSGIKILRSLNVENATQVIVQFELEVPIDQAVQDVRDRVSEVLAELPPQAEAPVIQKFDVGAAPVLGLALAGPLSPRALTDLADDVVKERLQRIPGVGGVDIVGGRERQIKILLDPAKLAGIGVSVDDVANAVRAQNLDMPGGYVERGGRELTVKTLGQVKTTGDIANIVIPNPGGHLARVRDVAEVVDTVADERSASYLNGTSAVALVVRKQSGANTVAVAHRVQDALAELGPTIEKAGATISVPTDNSVYIEHSIKDVQFDLLFGAVLATVIILLFLRDFRATIISAIAIPTSVVATFGFIWVMGFTFNNMTMLALSLSIGILIDDAIVVIENIHRHMEEHRRPAMQAASTATAEIFLAVLAVTSCILAVFVPVALMKGIIGRFFFQFGLTVSFAVAVSMLVSFTLTPMLSSRFLAAPDHTRRPNAAARALLAVLDAIDRAYERVLRVALRRRWLTVAVAVASLVGAVMLLTRVKAEFIPPEDRGEFALNVELPAGASIDTSKKLVAAIAEDIRKHAPGVEQTFTTIGEGTQGQVNQAKVQVVLDPRSQRSYHQEELMAWTRARYAGVKDVNISVTPISPIGGGGGFRQQPIQFNVRGNDMDELIAVTEKLKQELHKVPGLVDIDSTHRGGKPQVSIRVDRDRAADLGVPVASVASAVRALVAEDAVSELKEGIEAYDITLQLAAEQRADIESLPNIQVRSVTGQLVDLSSVVQVEHTEAPTQIERQAGQRQITILAAMEGITLGEAMEHVNAVAARVVPASMTTDYAGQAEVMAESFGYMLLALFLAVVLVYMILAAQFDSFVQPVTIMLSLPLSLIGAFGGLYVTGMTMNIFSMIGIIMLMGLVTKNAILLIDFTIQLRREGLGMYDALVRAGRIRLRPILMTTAAMIFGMLPVALALSEGGETRAPMAVCVIGGLITSTVLTLVVVPVVYTFMDAMTESRLVKWLGRTLMPSSASPAPHQPVRPIEDAAE